MGNSRNKTNVVSRPHGYYLMLLYPRDIFAISWTRRLQGVNSVGSGHRFITSETRCLLLSSPCFHRSETCLYFITTFWATDRVWGRWPDESLPETINVCELEGRELVWREAGEQGVEDVEVLLLRISVGHAVFLQEEALDSSWNHKLWLC